MSDTQKQRVRKIVGVKGMNDLLPADTPLWEHFDNTVHNMLRAYGYQQIRTSVVEQTQLLVRDIGEVTDIVEKEMYTFTDALNDEQLAMYPEGTAAAVHAVIERDLLCGGPKRLWYTDPMFRRERPQRGHYRQFHQVGVEALGFVGPDIDAEVILMCQWLWDDLGLVGLKLELDSLGQAEERAARHADLIRYLEGFQGTLDEDSRRRLCNNPLRVLDTESPALQDMAAGTPKLIDHLGDESRVHFENVQELLKANNIPFTINPRLMRELDYYNLAVFEWTTDKLSVQGAVVGGGRYDPLIGQIGGKPIPACDWVMGVEYVIELLREEKLEPEAQGCNVYTVHQGDEAQVQALIAAERLHDAGLDVTLHASPEGRNGSFKSQFKRADAGDTSYAVIIGDDEITQGVAQVKPLRGDPTVDAQQTVPSGQLADHLVGTLVANND